MAQHLRDGKRWLIAATAVALMGSAPPVTAHTASQEASDRSTASARADGFELVWRDPGGDVGMKEQGAPISTSVNAPDETNTDFKTFKVDANRRRIRVVMTFRELRTTDPSRREDSTNISVYLEPPHEPGEFKMVAFHVYSEAGSRIERRWRAFITNGQATQNPCVNMRPDYTLDAERARITVNIPKKCLDGMRRFRVSAVADRTAWTGASPDDEVIIDYRDDPGNTSFRNRAHQSRLISRW